MGGGREEARTRPTILLHFPFFMISTADCALGFCFVLIMANDLNYAQLNKGDVCVDKTKIIKNKSAYLRICFLNGVEAG